MSDYSSAKGFYYLINGQNEKEELSSELNQHIKELSYETPFECDELPSHTHRFSATGRYNFELNLNALNEELSQYLPSDAHDVIFEYQDDSWNVTESFNVDEVYSLRKGLLESIDHVSDETSLFTQRERCLKQTQDIAVNPLLALPSYHKTNELDFD